MSLCKRICTEKSKNINILKNETKMIEIPMNYRYLNQSCKKQGAIYLQSLHNYIPFAHPLHLRESTSYKPLIWNIGLKRNMVPIYSMKNSTLVVLRIDLEKKEP